MSFGDDGAETSLNSLCHLKVGASSMAAKWHIPVLLKNQKDRYPVKTRKQIRSFMINVAF